MNQETKTHHWHFQRIGGLDQVKLTSVEDIRHLEQLDPKLWVALSCPTQGLEFDTKVMAWLDTDADGHIRIPEIVDATKWTCERLNDLTGLMAGSPTLPLDVINTDSDAGKKLLATAHAILHDQKKTDSTYLTQEDVALASTQAAQAIFNGDGVFPASDMLDADIKQFVQDALSVMGGVADVSTQPGINSEIAHAFVQTLANWLAWHKSLEDATSVFGQTTPQVWGLTQSLKEKFDDYFLRSDLASYAPQAQTALNVDEKFLVPAQNGVLDDAALAALPLSRIEPNRPLNLVSGINPVWRADVEQFAQLVRPLLTQPESMSRQEWLDIQKALASYAQAVASQPTVNTVNTTIAPSSAIDKLGQERIQEIVQGDVLKRFDALVTKDKQTPVAATDIEELERLVAYNRYLHRLLMNFVSFHDFFDLHGTSAAFQAGQLYIDGRRCDLCVNVADVGQHTALSNYSELFLLYCECTRQANVQAEKEKIIIAAAVTAGNEDLLMEGRNGVFIDNHGRDWEAHVVKVLTKPISLRQAAWAPYKRIGKFITDQINKWASSKDAAITQLSTDKIQAVGDGITTPPVTSPAPATQAAPKFDIGRSVGIFAAVGLALGALGTAIASITQALFGLQWWQFPLVFLGLFLIISGPSMILAWLKLRQRTLGPLLEASGWAVNGSIKINYSLGGQLTELAQLPPNAKRDLIDPYKDKKKTGLWVFLIALLVGALAVGGWLWYQKKLPWHASSLPTTETVQQAPAQQKPETPAQPKPETPPEETKISP